MSDFIQFKIAGMAAEAIQSLLDGKKAARTVENICDSLSPLIADPETEKMLQDMREQAVKMSYNFQRIYTRNAREIFSGTQQPADRRRTDRDSSGSTQRAAAPLRSESATRKDSPASGTDSPAGESTR